MRARRLTLIFAAFAITTAVAVTAFSLLRSLIEPPARSGVAQVGGPFQLINHLGQPVSEADFKGRHMLVYFGYTFCPDVCPIELQTMSEALDQLGEAAQSVKPILITIDPERDTPEVLAAYREHFHPSLVALTGTVEQVRQAAKAFRVYYARTDDSADYFMDHSSFVYLMDPQGRYLTHFRPATSPEEMAKRIRAAL